MASHSSYEEVAALEEPAARRVLAEGDPGERVWAVWALSMRSTTHADAMAQRVRTEPNPGVRRHLTVVLAGHGHLDLLVGLARHDPDASVRASASRLVARLAASGDIPWIVVVERLRDDGDVVRETILDELKGPLTDDVQAAVVACAQDATSTVRLDAIECLLRAGAAAEVVAVLQRAVAEGWATDRDACLGRWLEIEPPSVVLARLQDAPRELRIAALEAMTRPTWADVASLAESDDPEIARALLRRLGHGRADMPLIVLARWYVWQPRMDPDDDSPIHAGLAHDLGARLDAVDAVEPEVALGSILRVVADRSQAWLDARADQAPGPWDDFDDDEDSYGGVDWLTPAVERVRVEAERLLARSR